jgi:hypothetical protein
MKEFLPGLQQKDHGHKCHFHDTRPDTRPPTLPISTHCQHANLCTASFAVEANIASSPWDINICASQWI